MQAEQTAAAQHGARGAFHPVISCWKREGRTSFNESGALLCTAAAIKSVIYLSVCNRNCIKVSLCQQSPCSSKPQARLERPFPPCSAASPCRFPSARCLAVRCSPLVHNHRVSAASANRAAPLALEALSARAVEPVRVSVGPAASPFYARVVRRPKYRGRRTALCVCLLPRRPGPAERPAHVPAVGQPRPSPRRARGRAVQSAIWFGFVRSVRSVRLSPAAPPVPPEAKMARWGAVPPVP